MGHDTFPHEDFDQLPEEEFLKSEQELKRDIKRIEREAKKERAWHDKEVEALRGQIRELLAKNMELTETNNIFARGLENLRKDNKVITEPHYWHRGGKDLRERINEIIGLNKRIVAMVTTKSSTQGDANEVLILTEHFDKTRPIRPINQPLFRE